jgi:hypothetical protein
MLHRCQSLIVVALPPEGRRKNKRRAYAILLDQQNQGPFDTSTTGAPLTAANRSSTSPSSAVVNFTALLATLRPMRHGNSLPDRMSHHRPRQHHEIRRALILGNSSPVLCVSHGTCMVRLSCCCSLSGSGGWTVRVCMSSQMNYEFEVPI